MHQSTKRILTAAIIGAAGLGGVCCQSDPMAQPSGPPPGQPAASGEAAFEAALVSANATVIAIDPTARTFTLRNWEGQVKTFTATPDVRNFSQIRLGDQVRTTIVDEVAVYISNSKTPPKADAATAVRIAAKGAKPSIIIASTTDVVDKIHAVDSWNRTITLVGVSGPARTMRVAPNVDMSGLKPGDDVMVRFTQGLAIAVENN